MTSNSERHFAILPSRAFTDERIRQAHLKLLGVFGVLANTYGVCRPTQELIGKMMNYYRTTISELTSELIEWGYLRKVITSDYLPKGEADHVNSYQVLWHPDMTVPTYEEFHASSPTLVDSNPRPEGNHVLLANAFVVTVKSETGVERDVNESLTAALRLFRQGCTIEQITRMTKFMIEDRKKKHLPPPITLHNVAAWGALYRYVDV